MSIVTRQVKPILSVNAKDAKRRVINLYRAWMRQIPHTVEAYVIPKSEEDLKEKVREEFKKNAHHKDIRVIDMLVIKGRLDLEEITKRWQPKSVLMAHFKDTVNEKPTDFMSKFLSGHDP